MSGKDLRGQEGYGQTALEIIDQSRILSQDDLAVIEDLRDELVDNFLHTQVFRTRTEMEVSVLNDLKFPTPDAKYWQAQREQKVHFNEMVMLSYDYRKNLVEIRKLRKRMDQEENADEKELLQIEIERKTFIARNQERVAKDRIREIREWHEIKADLRERMEYGLTDCDEHQLVSYTQRWIKQAQVMGNSGSPAERNNLIAQLNMGVKKCIEKGLIGKVLGAFDERTAKQIRATFQLDEFNRPMRSIRVGTTVVPTPDHGRIA
jgi:hypothetical protein